MTQSSALRIWRSAEGEYVIASSAEQAIAIYVKESGYASLADWTRDSGETAEDWLPLDDDAVFPYTLEIEEPLVASEIALGPGEALRPWNAPPIGAVVEYVASKDGLVHVVTRRKAAREWCAEYGEPIYFASENC